MVVMVGVGVVRVGMGGWGLVDGWDISDIRQISVLAELG